MFFNVCYVCKKRRADLLYDTCAVQCGLHVFAPATGGMFLCIKVPECKGFYDEEDPGKAYAKYLKENLGLSVLPGSRTGPGGNNYVRVCFAHLEEKDLAEAGTRMAEPLQK